MQDPRPLRRPGRTLTPAGAPPTGPDRNKLLRAVLEATLSQILERQLVPGFFGEGQLTWKVQDGILQAVAGHNGERVELARDPDYLRLLARRLGAD